MPHLPLVTLKCTLKCMFKDISIKELRARLAEIADRVENGEAFRVIRRSKPSFVIMHIDADDPHEHWETVVDFTDGGKTEGVPAEDVIAALEQITDHE